MNRTDRKTLDSNANNSLIFKAGAASSGWRIVEAWSELGLPFELSIQWSLGCGPGQQARISVSHGTRVCVCAQDIVLHASNRSSEKNCIAVAIVDGFMPTANVLDSWQLCDGTTPVVFEVPPFAQRFDLQLGKRHLLNSTAVALIDGTGARIELSADALPAAGIGVGAVDRIEVLTPVSCQLRAIFMLSL